MEVQRDGQSTAMPKAKIRDMAAWSFGMDGSNSAKASIYPMANTVYQYKHIIVQLMTILLIEPTPTALKTSRLIFMQMTTRLK